MDAAGGGGGGGGGDGAAAASAAGAAPGTKGEHQLQLPLTVAWAVASKLPRAAGRHVMCQARKGQAEALQVGGQVRTPFRSNPVDR
eukprot:SAG22_NODE_987_length_6142_cov_3.152242_9_plen_86_part_01